ncbi:hypothetical protein LLG10_02900 [bacterium]|nr:hypothetical protein [bacterium]
MADYNSGRLWNSRGCISPDFSLKGNRDLYITDGSTIKISCPEKIIHYKTDKALESKLIQEKTLEVRLKQPGDSSWLVTVASENYFASWNFTYLPGKNPGELNTTIVMTEKDKTDKAWSLYKKMVNQLDSF